MEYVPVGRRTRLQRSLKEEESGKEKRRSWLNPRSRLRKKACENGGARDTDSVVDDDEIQVIGSKSEFEKWSAARQNNSIPEGTLGDVRNQNSGDFDSDQPHGSNNGKGKDVVSGNVGVEGNQVSGGLVCDQLASNEEGKVVGNINEGVEGYLNSGNLDKGAENERVGVEGNQNSGELDSDQLDSNEEGKAVENEHVGVEENLNLGKPSIDQVDHWRDDKEEVKDVRENVNAEGNQNMGDIDKFDRWHDKECKEAVNEKLGAGGNPNLCDLSNGEGKNVVRDDRNEECSDDSLQIVGEGWVADLCYDSHSSTVSSESSGEATSSYTTDGDEVDTSSHTTDEDEVVSSRESVSVSFEDTSDLSSSLSRENEIVTTKKGDYNSVCNFADDGGESSNTNASEKKVGDGKQKREEVFEAVFLKRVFDGLVLPVEPENNVQVGDFIGKRTRSHRKPNVRRKKVQDGTVSRPVDLDDSCSSSSDDIDDGNMRHTVFKSENLKSCKNGAKRKRGRPPKNSYVEINSIPVHNPKTGNVNVNGCDNGGKRKRGRPRKDSSVELKSRLTKKQRISNLESIEVEKILLSTIQENGNLGLEPLIPCLNVMLNRKFRFGVQNQVSDSVPEEEKELFKELHEALQFSDSGAGTSCLDEEEDMLPCDSAILQEKLCLKGKHYLIHEDEIGIRCKFCSFVKLESRHVTPPFSKDPFGRADKRYNGLFPYDDGTAYDRFRFSDSSCHPQVEHSDDTEGTVWDLIPGTKASLYPHQREGFEFIWRNIGGAIELEKLGKPSKFGLGGCIICHAPGTGKTRLAITFLKTFIKQYPTSKPVIIAPRSMLLTWEEEFARWDFNVPFLNMNKKELSGKEDVEVLKQCKTIRHTTDVVRMAKLCTWAKGKGVLGISYNLFTNLAGEKRGTDERVRQVLLKQPGILVLDEGHTPRNEDTNMWNVLIKVETKRRIILSGTPFQNNFAELHNTLSLVREEFGDPVLQGKFVNCGKKNFTERRGSMGSHVSEARRIVDLKNRLKPFVHVHKGEILRESLRGLFHSVLVLSPSELQKTYLKHLGGIRNICKLDHLFSIVSVHPSALIYVNQSDPSKRKKKTVELPDFVDKGLLKKHKQDLDAGVKIRFLFDLIKLARGEKVLVFSLYLAPLDFIADLLKSHFDWDEGKEVLKMDGEKDMKMRQSYIRLFNDPESEARVLLASTKACSEGIHLVGASRVVLLDVAWNPSVERQAISRAYRLGQKKDVFVYHLITAGIYEEDKCCKQLTKDRLSEMVFSSEEGRQEISNTSGASKDWILEEMTQNERIKGIFKKIILQPKAEKLIETFGVP